MTVRHVVEVPDASGRVELVEPTFFGTLRVEVDGQPVAKTGFFSSKYPIPTHSGGTVDISVTPDLLRGGLVVKGGGLDQRLGAQMPLWLGILAFLPFGLAGVGGLIGGIMGGVGWAINQQVARTSWPVMIRVAAMLAVTAGAGVGYFVLALAFNLALH